MGKPEAGKLPEGAGAVAAEAAAGNRRRWGEWPAVAVLLAVFAGLAVSAFMGESATFDEATYLVSGYSYWRWNDYRLDPDHPPLLKRWAALPLLVASPWMPPLDGAAGAGDDTLTGRAALDLWASATMNSDIQWTFSHLVLYGLRDEALRRCGVNHPFLVPGTAALSAEDFLNNADALLRAARLAMVVLGVLLGLLIFLWARDLFGPAGGLIALSLFCLDPNFIAHSGLVTTDVGVTLFMFGAVYFFWRTCRKWKLRDAALCALCFGLAVACKFSALLLLPMFVVLGLVWAGVTPRRLRIAAGLILACAMAAYALLWAAYGFRFSAARDPEKTARMETRRAEEAHAPLPPGYTPGHFPLEAELRRGAATRSLLPLYPQGVPEDILQKALPNVPLPVSARLMLFAHRHHLVPEAYLYGLAFIARFSQARSSFLLGEHSTRGWWYYFPVAFALKTPLLTLLAIVFVLVWMMRRGGKSRGHLLWLCTPVAIYLAVSMTRNLNIGHRHLLPIYPFLFVLCGGLGAVWERLPRRGLVAAAALAALAFNANVILWRPALVWPHYLAYFNELAGGPRDGYKCLVDSNLDWGQDLKGLKAWLVRRGIREPIKLCYFGTADPRYYGIPHLNLSLAWFPFEPLVSGRDIPVSGYAAVSATNLQGAYASPQARETLRRILGGATLVDTVGYSIFIYYHP